MEMTEKVHRVRRCSAICVVGLVFWSDAVPGHAICEMQYRRIEE